MVEDQELKPFGGRIVPEKESCFFFFRLNYVLLQHFCQPEKLLFSFCVKNWVLLTPMTTFPY